MCETVLGSMESTCTSLWEIRSVPLQVSKKCVLIHWEVVQPLVSCRKHRWYLTSIYLKGTAVTPTVGYKLNLSVCTREVKLFSYKSIS